MRNIKKQIPNKYYKKLKSLLKLIFFLILFISIYPFLSSYFKVSKQYNPKILITSPKPIQESSALPIRLIIPAINFNSKIENVGLVANNTMGVPVGREDVAWYDLGPIPGNIGSAVIDGHYGWWANTGAPAVFNNLSKLHKGEKIYVENSNKKITSFLVSKIQIYTPNSNSTKIFNSNDGKSHLNLITCEGVWNNTTKTYSNRTVVFSNKINVILLKFKLKYIIKPWLI